jgi:hypothetical protein
MMRLSSGLSDCAAYLPLLTHFVVVFLASLLR